MNEALVTANLESPDPQIDYAAQAARLESLVRRGHLTLGQASKGTGQSTAVLSQFMNSRYEGRVADVAAKVKAFLDEYLHRLATGGQISFVKGIRVATEIFAVLRFALENLILAILVGDPGIGKTRALLEFVLLHPGVCVLITITKATASLKAVLEELADALRLLRGEEAAGGGGGDLEG